MGHMEDFWEEQHKITNLDGLSDHSGRDVWDFLQVKPCGKVLNIGVGTGRCTKELRELGCEVSVLDISKLSFERVKDTVTKCYLPSELASLPSDYFDFIISHSVSQHMCDEDLREQIRQCCRSLKNGGVLAMHYLVSDGVILSNNVVGRNNLRQEGGSMCRTTEEMLSFFEDKSEVTILNSRTDFPDIQCHWEALQFSKKIKQNEIKSLDVVNLYDDTYFLGGISKHNKQFIGAAGFVEFKKGQIAPYKVAFANQVEFKDKNILDVGCGRGEVLKYCKAFGAGECVGIDYSHSAVTLAKQFNNGNGVKIYEIFLSDIKLVKETFDIVFMMDVLEHVSTAEWTSFYNDMIRLKKITPNGLVIGTTPSRIGGDYLNMHNNYWSESELRDFFEKYFKDVYVCDTEDHYTVIARFPKNEV